MRRLIGITAEFEGQIQVAVQHDDFDRAANALKETQQKIFALAEDEVVEPHVRTALQSSADELGQLAADTSLRKEPRIFWRKCMEVCDSIDKYATTMSHR